MKATVLIQLLLLVTSLPLTTANQVDCPPWFFPDADNGTECVCSSVVTDQAVKCRNDRAFLRIGVCMTYNDDTNDTEIGPCPYILQRSNLSHNNNLFFSLPKHTSNLNSFMCGPLHRTGQLCGECEDGFGPALYSYTLECKKCWGHGAGWLLYITLTVIPATIIYIIVVVFHVSATSPPLNAFVFFCHFTVYIFRTQPDLYFLIANELKGFSHELLKVILALCGIWSLDFFRPIVPPFCVSPHMKNLPAFALEYIEAFFPLILILITYICIKLHDHNFRPVVLLWKPFHRCFVYFRRSWDSEASVINAFATFLLLSFSKILFVCFVWLSGIQVKLLNGNGTILSSGPHVMYYASTVEYFSEDRIPFAVVSICVAFTFVVFPALLLVLYPTRMFRRCIICCRFGRWHALHTFMEAFQGQFKDGTNGTRDFRMVSALYLVYRITALLQYFGNHIRYDVYVWLITAVVLAGTSLFFSNVRPYKVDHSNTVDSLLLALLSIQALISLLVKYLRNPRYSYVVGLTGLIIMSIPHAALVLYILYIISKKIRILQPLKRKCRCLLSGVHWNNHSLSEANSGYGGLDTDSLPDRLVNPDEYEPLIPAVNHREHQSESYEVPARVTAMNTYGLVDD